MKWPLRAGLATWRQVVKCDKIFIMFCKRNKLDYLKAM